MTVKLCPCPATAGPGYRRYIVAWMTCIGLTIVLMMRCELGIAILRLLDGDMQAVVVQNETSHQSMVTFVRIHLVKWNHLKVGIIESAFFVGYAIFSVPGGILATYFPAHWVLGMAVAVTCALNLLVPPFVHLGHSFFFVFILRILQGAAEGCLYPSVHALWRHWAPTTERAKLVSVSFFGMALGPILGYPLTGQMIQKVDWSLPFYVYGVCGLIWSVFWLTLVAPTPKEDRFMSPEELEYIEKHANPHNLVLPKFSNVPWLSMLSSTPVIAIIVANMGRNWIYQFSMTGLPKYYDDVYGMSEAKIGFAMMIPYIVMAVLTLFAGCFSDYLYRRFEWRIGSVRKLMNTVGFTLVSISLFALGFAQRAWLSTLFISFAIGSLAIAMAGFAVNHLDVAPQYAGILMGMSNGLGTVSGVVSPILASKLTVDHSRQSWQAFFSISAALELFCSIFYFIFSSGEVQPWAKSTDGENEKLNSKDQEKPPIKTSEPDDSIEDKVRSRKSSES